MGSDPTRTADSGFSYRPTLEAPKAGQSNSYLPQALNLPGASLSGGMDSDHIE